MSFEFPKTTFRAQCTRVIDGDTIDVYIDQGRRIFTTDRIRLLGVDTPELHAKDPLIRANAVKAKDWLTGIIKPGPIGDWNLLITLEKDPDNFGRWLGVVQTKDAAGVVINVNEELIRLGLAVPFKG